MEDFLESLTSYEAARFKLKVIQDLSGAWIATVSIDGKPTAAETRAKTKAQAVIMALGHELGREIEEARPRYCEVCGPKGNIVRAAGHDKMTGKLVCWEHVTRPHSVRRQGRVAYRDEDTGIK